MLERDDQTRRAQRAHGLHVVLLALGQDRRAHDAHEERRVHDGDRDDGAVDPGATHRRDPDGEQQAGNAEEHVHHPVDAVVPRAAGIAGREAEPATRDHREANRQHRDVERDPRAVDDATQDVAAEAIGAEEGLRARPGFDEVEVLLVRRVRRQHAGEQGHADDRQRERGADHDDHIARDSPKSFRRRLRERGA